VKNNPASALRTLEAGLFIQGIQFSVNDWEDLEGKRRTYQPVKP